ncbi:hypothetical protein BGZ90_009888 [Linnemannia elongata]|nr:hypothetical protein BGZ90_009888 [Linnemannia elongata]
MAITPGAGNKPHPHTSMYASSRYFSSPPYYPISPLLYWHKPQPQPQYAAWPLPAPNCRFLVDLSPPWIWPQTFGTLEPPYSSGHSMTAGSANNALFMWDPFQAGVYWSYGTVSHVWGSIQRDENDCFGGAGLSGVANADIHVLDMLTREWTAGKPADAIQARQYMACAVSGDSFVTWGGNGLGYG